MYKPIYSPCYNDSIAQNVWGVCGVNYCNASVLWNRIIKIMKELNLKKTKILIQKQNTF